MHRTESDNFIVVGGLNQFTDGPPGTTINAVDLNTIVEELCYVITQNGLSVLTVGTETNQQLYAAIATQIAASAAANPLLNVNFEAKYLLVSLSSVDTVDVTAERLSVLNSSFVPAFLDDLDATFNIGTDLMAGTSEKASTWYQLWIDSLGARLMVPDLEGTADTNTLNSLEDSTANFVTDKVSVGDIVYNLTDYTQGYVGSIIASDELGIVDANGLDLDLFPDGNEDYKIHMLSPTGLGSYKANIGAAFNNSGSDLEKVVKNGSARRTQSLWHTGNGYGSSSTKIPKFTTEAIAANQEVVKIKNDAATGFTIEAILNCTVSVILSGSYTNQQYIGLSLNSTELTTDVVSITAADLLAIARTSAAAQLQSISVVVDLEPGDILRPHTSGLTFTNAAERIFVHAAEIV